MTDSTKVTTSPIVVISMSYGYGVKNLVLQVRNGKLHANGNEVIVNNSSDVPRGDFFPVYVSEKAEDYMASIRDSFWDIANCDVGGLLGAFLVECIAYRLVDGTITQDLALHSCYGHLHLVRGTSFKFLGPSNELDEVDYILTRALGVKPGSIEYEKLHLKEKEKEPVGKLD